MKRILALALLLSCAASCDDAVAPLATGPLAVGGDLLGELVEIPLMVPPRHHYPVDGLLAPKWFAQAQARHPTTPLYRWQYGPVGPREPIDFDKPDD